MGHNSDLLSQLVELCKGTGTVASVDLTVLESMTAARLDICTYITEHAHIINY